MIVSANKILLCPSCDKPLDGTGEEYTIPGKVGDDSLANDSCGWCDEEFTVKNNGDGTVSVTHI